MPLISMMKIDSLGEDEFLSSWSSEWVRVGVRGWRNTWRPSPPNSLSNPPLAPWHAQKPKIYITDPRNPENTAKKSTSSPPARAAGAGDVARSCLPTLVRGGHLGFTTTSATPHWHNNAGKSNFVCNSKFEDIPINQKRKSSFAYSWKSHHFGGFQTRQSNTSGARVVRSIRTVGTFDTSVHVCKLFWFIIFERKKFFFGSKQRYISDQYTL